MNKVEIDRSLRNDKKKRRVIIRTEKVTTMSYKETKDQIKIIREAIARLDNQIKNINVEKARLVVFLKEYQDVLKS